MNAAIKTIGWGLFCTCSWTWCIGMFLPLIMVDRWGWAGFAAFALPNVIGCAAFGYVLRDRARAQRMVSEHRAAMRLFSIVTLANHVFFIGFIAWVLAPFEYWDGIRLAVIAPIAFLAVSALLSRLPRVAWLPFAALVYAFSLAVFAVIGPATLEDVPARLGEMTAWGSGLMWLVPALVFGFLLCPYLDLTFHRALSSSPSRHAFAVFGAAFTVMILLTVAYWDALAVGLSWIVLGHITAQSIFTMAAHQRELHDAEDDVSAADRASTGRGTARLAARGTARLAAARLIATFAPLLALPLAFAGAFLTDALGASIDMYLRFLVFYGLIFPAYVLLFIGPRPVLRLKQAHLFAFTIAVLAAAPLYELAFIHDLAALAVVPPVAIVLWAALPHLHRPGT